MKPMRDNSGEFPAYAWPGGYPIYYLFLDGEICCPACANRKNGSDADITLETEKQWRLVDMEIHYEGGPLQCAHCNTFIKSAYGSVDMDAE